MLRFIGEHPALVFASVTVLVWGQSAPAVGTLPASAQTIYNATYTLGTIYLVGKTALDVVAAHNPAAAAIRFVERLILLSLALLAVRCFGFELADTVASAKANPDGSLALAAAVIVLRVAFAFAPAREPATARGVEAAGLGYSALAWPRRERSAQDIHRTAVHEAGHLLLYGRCTELPADLAVKVLAELGDMDLYRGQVTHSDDIPSVLTEGYLHWSMLMYLAGAEAEYIALGDRADGSCDDNSKWLNAATAYLSSGFGDVFYANPAGDVQLAHNRAVLNDLKTECVREVRDFLTANRALLDDLAAEIADQKTLDLEQLEPYLARVVVARPR